LERINPSSSARFRLIAAVAAGDNLIKQVGLFL